MKFTLSVLFTLILFSSQSQNPLFQWAKRIGGPLGDHGQSIATDYRGNVFTAGFYRGNIDFDPGPATYTLPSTYMGTFINKLDPFGNLLWTKNFDDSIKISFNSITTDKTGNVYATGYFSDTLDFDPSIATNTVISNGGEDIFILKLDANGNFAWVKTIGALGADRSVDIKIDNAGNIYTTGYFSNTVDFDPSPATYTLANGGTFVIKMDAVGNLVWAKNSGSAPAIEQVYAIYVDTAGSVYNAGRFVGICDFDPGPATFTLSGGGSMDGFISKLDASGNFVWAKGFGGTNTDEVYAITGDRNGNIYVTGDFLSSNADFDPGPGTYTATAMSGGIDIFILKLTTSGNFGWAKIMSGVGAESGYAIAYDNGAIYTTGAYSSPVDFDPGPSTVNLPTFGFYNIFISKLDTSGNFVWAEGMGGAQSETTNDIAIDGYGNIFTTGIFQSAALDFDFGPGTFTLSSAGDYDVFIHKINNCLPPSPVIDITPVSNHTICANEIATLMATSTGTISWYNSPASTTPLASGLTFTPTLSAAGTYTFYAEAQNCTHISPRISIVVVVELCAGLKQIEAEQNTLVIYPNPSSGLINIEVEDPNGNYKNGASISIVNGLGQVVLEKNLSMESRNGTTNLFAVDIQHLPKGIYCVKFMSESKTKTATILKD